MVLCSLYGINFFMNTIIFVTFHYILYTTHKGVPQTTIIIDETLHSCMQTNIFSELKAFLPVIFVIELRCEKLGWTIVIG